MVTVNESAILDRFFPSEKPQRASVVEEIAKAILVKIPHDHTIKKDELILALDEAVTNAMEHGNRWDPGKRIHVKSCYTNSELIIRISDEGSGFDIETLANPSEYKSVMNKRGRGIPLITRFSRASWNRKGNQIEMRINLF